MHNVLWVILVVRVSTNLHFEFLPEIVDRPDNSFQHTTIWDTQILFSNNILNEYYANWEPAMFLFFGALDSGEKRDFPSIKRD